KLVNTATMELKILEETGGVGTTGTTTGSGGGGATTGSGIGGAGGGAGAGVTATGCHRERSLALSVSTGAPLGKCPALAPVPPLSCHNVQSVNGAGIVGVGS